VQLEPLLGPAHAPVRGHEVPGGLVGPGAAVGPGQPGRHRQAEVQADVQDHTACAHALGVEHPEPVTVVLEVAQLLHEALGVQGPALAVAGDPAQQGAPAVQLRPLQALGAHLQVMTRHALVVDGGGLGPGVELGVARRYVPPHAARSGHVLAGTRVVDAARPGGRDPALDPVQRLGDVEMGPGQVRDGGVREVLHPGLQGVGAVQDPGRVGVQGPAGGLDRRPAVVAVVVVDPTGDLLLLGDDLPQPLDAPGVGLLGVDLGAQRGPAAQGVDLGADGVRLRCPRCQVVQHVRDLPVRLGGAGRGPTGAVLQGLVADGLGAEGLEEPARCGVPAGLFGAECELATGGDDAVVGGLAQRLRPRAERARQSLQARADGLPVLGGVGGHEVEHVTGLQRGGEVVDLGGGQTGLGVLDLEPEAFVQGGPGDRVLTVLVGDGRDPTEQVRCVLGARRDRVGGVVGDLGVVPRDADRGGGERVRGRDPVDVGVGQVVECRRGTCGGGVTVRGARGGVGSGRVGALIA
jgi:hypothetical protein